MTRQGIDSTRADPKGLFACGTECASLSRFIAQVPGLVSRGAKLRPRKITARNPSDC